MFIASDGTTTAAYPDFNYGPNSSMPAKLSSPVSTAAVTTQSASDAYSQVMNYVGNNWWSRDLIDNRIIGNVQNNTQPAGGVPALAPVPAELTAVTTNPAISRPAGWDTDGDGMPDVWEKSMGLNPNSAADATTDFNTSGYVNVQKYLDEIGAFPAPGPLVFTGATNNRYAKITNWNMTFQPSRFDEVQINSGTALIDAIGQHAGTFKIATNAEDTASLNITSGWLQVENQLIIGGTATSVATLNLSGGELTAMTLSKGAGGVFNFTGGKLHAGTVLFDLMNQGGTIAPGNRANAVTIVNATPVALSSIGTTHILGNLAMQSGAIEIELASAASYDKLAVDGSLTAGGNLNVSLVNSYKPAKGSSFDILDWGTLSGAFSTLQLPDLNGRIIWDTSHLYGSGAGGTISVHDTFYAGDANRDSLVDVADISAMMTALADLSKYQTSNNLADPQLLLIANLASGDNLVNNADVQSLINLLANGGGSGALNAVPEPSAMVLSLLGAVAFMISLGCRRLPRS